MKSRDIYMKVLILKKINVIDIYVKYIRECIEILENINVLLSYTRVTII